ncbi:MAG: biopolymer transporter ExbD [Polyangiaceae bacterium]
MSTQDDEIVTGINVTPLVDVTLVLLVIFMVTAKLISSQGVPMDLPKAASGNAVQTMLTVSVDAEGHASLNGKSASDDTELRRVAHEAIIREPELRTVVQAGASVPHGHVVHVMDQLRQAGIGKIAFAVDPVSPAAPNP